MTKKINHFPEDFFFGVSNAAGQVEDELQDTWLKFAERGRVSCFKDVPRSQERLRFWSQPEVELNLAQELGVKVFRLSFAWERLTPSPGVWDQKAADRYREILLMIKERGIKVMATLFHHAIPPWLQDVEGWVAPSSVEHFRFYSEKCHEQFGDLISYWITLNEPVPWSFLTYTEGLFPPGIKGSWFDHFSALEHMSEAHQNFYRFVNKSVPVGIAQHIGFHQGRGTLNKLLTKFSDPLAHWDFLKKIEGSMDFFGVNYYGAEWMTLKGPAQYEDLEFSDAGRAVSPDGLLWVLRKIHRLYPALPILITENGVGDGTDILRPPYLMEHLAVVLKAIEEKIPVKGYVHWTLSDNLEWSDGYGPKFGLVHVDRENNLKRTPRDSFYLYQKIIKEHGLDYNEREAIWNKYESHFGETRPYWRSENGKAGRDVPLMRKTPAHDWRFKV